MLTKNNRQPKLTFMITTSAELPEDSPQPLARLNTVTRAIRELEHEQHAYVMMARVNGSSWTQIASILGVSKQAAHKKFSRMRPEDRR